MTRESGDIYFYQVRSNSDDLVFTLVRNARKSGWRVCIRGASPEQLQKTESRLWVQTSTLFFGVGVAGSEFDAEHSVLLSISDTRANNPDALIILQGAVVQPEEMRGFHRVMIVFSGESREATSIARQMWKSLARLNLPMKYYRQQDGRWKQMHSTSSEAKKSRAATQ